MSEKRFIFATNEKWFLFDNETEEYMDMEDCKDKLNELAEENGQLKEELNNLKKDETMLYHYYTLARYGGDGV